MRRISAISASVMIGIVGIDHFHGSLGWRRFIAEQRNRLPEIPDKCLGIKTNIEVDIVRQQARRDADKSRRIIARAPPDRLKAFFLPHGMEVAQKGFRQLTSRTPRPAAGIAALADPPRWLQTGIDGGLLWFRLRPQRANFDSWLLRRDEITHTELT